MNLTKKQIFSSGFKPKSTTKKAKSIIRSEIKDYYSHNSENRRFGKDYLKNMQMDANSYSAGSGKSDWDKGKELVNAGCFACYYDEQRKMLDRIYGKDVVNKWSAVKVHEVYASLIGREYATLLRQKNKN